MRFPATIADFAKEVGVEHNELERIADLDLWEEIRLRKRRGGIRRVFASTSADHREILDRVKKLLDKTLPRSSIAYAVRGRGAARAARQHCRAPWIGEIDHRDFYPSIGQPLVEQLFLQLGCGPPLAKLLSRLTTRAGVLVQGSPASTMIAGGVLDTLTPKLSTEAQRLGVKLLIYDDNVFASGRNRLQVEAFLDVYENAVATLRLPTHARRVVPRDRALVLGYRVRHRTPRISKEYRRNLTRKVRRAQKRGIKSKKRRRSLEGKIRHIELHGHRRQAAALRASLAEALKTSRRSSSGRRRIPKARRSHHAQGPG